MSRFIISARVVPDGPTFTVTGSDAWALIELVAAGPRGCMPIDDPAPRWSGYLHKLRHRRGLAIETVHESHHGGVPGNHARYVLRSRLEIFSRNDESERTAA